MNEEFYKDMKQLLEATVSQSEQRMMDRMDQRFEERDEKVEKRFEQ